MFQTLELYKQDLKATRKLKRLQWDALLKQKELQGSPKCKTTVLEDFSFNQKKVRQKMDQTRKHEL